VEWFFDPGAEKANLIVETKRLFLQRTHGRLQRHCRYQTVPAF